MATITVLNTSSNLSAKTLLAAENANTVSGLLTFNRSPSAPFAVQAASANVPNLDADKLDGIDSTGFAQLAAAANAFSVASATTNAITVTNTTSGAAAFTRIQETGGTNSSFWDTFSQAFTTAASAIQSGARWLCSGAGGLALDASNAAGVIKFYTQSALRWGISAAGDLTFGASSHIADGAGTPTIASGFGTSPSITGQSYAFVITVGTTNPVFGQVNFGTTYSSAPTVVCSGDNLTAGVSYTIVSVSTTQVSFQTSTGWPSGTKINVLVRGS